MLPEPLVLSEFLARCAESLGTSAINYRNVPLDRRVHRVAVCGGSGADFVGAAAAARADVLVTGDLKYHGFQDPPATWYSWMWGTVRANGPSFTIGPRLFAQNLLLLQS